MLEAPVGLPQSQLSSSALMLWGLCELRYMLDAPEAEDDTDIFNKCIASSRPDIGKQHSPLPKVQAQHHRCWQQLVTVKIANILGSNPEVQQLNAYYH